MIGVGFKALAALVLLSGFAACSQTGSRAGYHEAYTQILSADGSVVSIDSEGNVVTNPKRSARRAKDEARRLAREEKEARRQARKRGETDAQIAASEPDYWWRGDGVDGRPSIIISLSEQRAYFLKDGVTVGMAPISSGREGYHTPAGRFSIIQKNRHHVSNLYGDYVDSAGNVVVANVGVRRDSRPAGTRFRGAPMPYFLRIVGGVGMHAGYLPGYAASHGCIRLPDEMARIYFENVAHGTPVAVRY